jgi:predicted PurR-regulated permease PerM
MSRIVPEPKIVPSGRREERPSQVVADGNRQGSIGSNATLLTVVLVIAGLYFARVVFMPLALALLLTFLLAPLVIRLRHWGVGRVLSVLVVVLLSFSILAVIGGIMTAQATDLAHKLPEYRHNVREKLDSLRASGGGLINRATRIAHSFTRELTPAPAPSSPRDQPAEEKPVPVEIRKAPFAPMEIIQKVLGSVLNIAVMAGIVIVFVIFMLIQREDLRDRFIRLLGAARVNDTTEALDDAAGRLSRYLLVQLLINAGFGLLAGTGLYFIGVPNPILWGMLAALLRYVPYLGIWVAAIMPALVAFAVEPGWIRLPIVFGLYFGIDLMMYNFVEPLLYGTSTGVSPMGILVAAVFWTWLWGPVGLLLATPLTVCLVVLGRYVPKLEFLSVILSDEPVLKPETRFYQRMLAMDLEEATQVAEEFIKGKSLEEFYDLVAIPALRMAEEERHRDRLDETRQDFIFQNTRFVIEDMAERADELVAGNHSTKPKTNGKNATQPKNDSANAEPGIICIPARDEADEIAALMMAQLLNKRGITPKILSADSLVSEYLEEVGHGQTRIACVVAVPPFGYTHARYLCRRLRDQFAEIKLVGAILTEGDIEQLRKRKPAIPADELAPSLRQALAAVLSFVPERNNEAQEPLLRSA